MIMHNKDESMDTATQLNLSGDLDIIVNDDDNLVNNQIKQLRRGIARTMLKGLYDYYNHLINEYVSI